MDSDAPTANSLEYEELKDTEIRLIKVVGNTESTSMDNMVLIMLSLLKPRRIQGDEVLPDEFETPSGMVLSLEHFELGSCPPFIALSYVWGDPAATRSITVNDRCLQIPANLSDALAQIYEISPTLQSGMDSSAQTPGSSPVELFIWADSICINQADKAERSRQVPRMTEVYSAAYSVLVWLGDFVRLQQARTDIHPGSAHNLLLSLMEMKDLDGFPKLVDEWKMEEPKSHWRETLSTYHDLITNPWFRRVWVMQECALSRRRPCALMGSYLISLEAIHSLPATIDEQATALDPDSSEISGLLDSVDWMETTKGLFWTSAALRDQFRAPEFGAKPTAEKLVSLMTKMGGKQATVPHDYIYGLLGMVDASTLPQHLRPDYTLPYARVFADYARFLIEQTGDLRLLMDRTRYPEPLDGVPSWVPNPATFKAGLSSEPEPLTRHVGGFEADGRVLTAEGTRVSELLLRHSHLGEQQDDGDVVKSLRAFYDEILARSAQIRGKSLTEVARDWLCDLVGRQLRAPRIHLQEFFARYPSVGDFVHLVNDGSLVADDDGEPFDFDLRVLALFSFFDYALLADGRVAVLHRCWGDAVEAGSQTSVWALKGSTRLSVLEVHADGYRYVGWLDMDVCLDQDFFANTEVSEVRLV